jgi:hypothetical protein
MNRQFLAANYCVAGCDTPSPYVKYGSVRFSPSPCTLLAKKCLGEQL